MHSTASKKIAALWTLTYSDLYAFPLTIAEVVRYWEGAETITENECRDALISLYPLIRERSGYYFLAGREKIVSRRVRRQRYVQEKKQLAEKVARILGKIPTVYLIGISGSVAVGAASADDDIDLFIITKKNTLFLTRIFILCILQFLGLRRRRRGEIQRNAVCVNMLLDETTLKLEAARQDIYTAREIAQLVPLFERQHSYQRFWKANQWVKSYLPNAAMRTVWFRKNSTDYGERIFARLPLLIPEKLVKLLQWHIIAAHTTNETVRENFLAFHPNDYRQRILKRREKRLKKLATLLNSGQTVNHERFLDKEKNIFYTA
jgi:hypothetical protein